MSDTEFPAELVERCAEQVRRIDRSCGWSMTIASVVLHESGHEGLVVALKEARAWIMDLIETPPAGTRGCETLAQIDDALRKAGVR